MKTRFGVLEAGNTLDVMPNARHQLRADAVTPAQARTIVRRMIAGWDPDDVKLVELLTSEVVTNAVLHAATEILLAVHEDGATVRVEVSDAGTRMPHIRDDPDVGGYGLGIVEGLAARGGVEPLPSAGKTVWFEVDARKRAGDEAVVRR